MAQVQDPNINIGDGQNNNGNPSVPNGSGSGDPKPQTNTENIEELVKARMAEKEEELRKKILEEIETEKNLTEAQKLEVERQKFQQEQENWKKKVETDTIALNVEKVKSIYNKAGFSEELINLLVNDVKLDFEVEQTKANNVVKAINSLLDSKTKELTNKIQSNQPSPTIKNGSTNGEKQSFFENFNQPKNEPKQSFFK